MDNARILPEIVRRLMQISKTNSLDNLTGLDVSYDASSAASGESGLQCLDAREYDSSLRPLVKAINTLIHSMEKRAKNQLRAERKRIKREIERRVRENAQADIEETLSGAHMGIWTIELEDEKEPRMFGDKTMHQLLGIEGDALTPEEMYRAWYENIESGYCDMVNEALVSMEHGTPTEAVYPWNHPAAGQIYVRCGGLLAKFDKPGFKIKGYHQDVTETMMTRRRQERAMFDAIVEAKKANAAKTEFISNMSHDIRTPINGILGMLEIAEKNADNKGVQAECRRKVKMAAEHLSSLINDVLDISKIESGTMAISRETFNIHELIDNSMTIVGPQAEESGIRLERDYANIKHPCLSGSPLHLRQIIINVIGNGIKYNKPGGFVSIHTEELCQRTGDNEKKASGHEEDAAAGERTFYRFTIEDSGIGMSEEFLLHLFEPFTQEGKDARTNYRGTGLGMAITKGLIEKMDGTIEVHSKSNEGTKIVIELPFEVRECSAKGGSAAKKDGESTDIKGMTVLLAEDNDLNREIADYMLKDAGAIVLDAVNGLEAYNIFLEHTRGEGFNGDEASNSEAAQAKHPEAKPAIDCILMDVMMPVMDGLEASRKIRYSGKAGAEVPIIVLSANAFTEDTEKAKAAGASAYLTKPLDTQKMLKTIASFRRSGDIPCPPPSSGSGNDEAMAQHPISK